MIVKAPLEGHGGLNCSFNVPRNELIAPTIKYIFM